MLPAERVGTEQVDRVGAEPDVFGFATRTRSPVRRRGAPSAPHIGGIDASRNTRQDRNRRRRSRGVPGAASLVGAPVAGCAGRGLVGCEVGGEVVDVGIGDVERPNPHRLSVTVLAHVGDTGVLVGIWSQTAPASRAAAPRTIVVWVDSVIRSPTRMENNCRMGRTSLDGSCTAAMTETPTARPWESSSPNSCSTSRGSCGPDVGGQRRDFIDDQHNQRVGGGGGVQAGVDRAAAARAAASPS